MLCLFVFRKTWDITIPYADNVVTIPIAQSHQPGGTRQAVKNGLTNNFLFTIKVNTQILSVHATSSWKNQTNSDKIFQSVLILISPNINKPI